MFLCEPCLEENFTNWAFPVSYGKCEYCGNVRSCVDISSKCLNPKNKTTDIEGNEISFDNNGNPYRK